MTRRGWMVATMVCLVACFAIAATQKSAVDGRWQGTLDTADGPLTVTYNFKAKGQVLTGTEESPMFSRSISEGKVNGDKISFKTTVNGNTIDHQGTVSGDTIQLKSYGPGGEFDVTLKRVSSEKIFASSNSPIHGGYSTVSAAGRRCSLAISPRAA